MDDQKIMLWLWVCRFLSKGDNHTPLFLEIKLFVTNHKLWNILFYDDLLFWHSAVLLETNPDSAVMLQCWFCDICWTYPCVIFNSLLLISFGPTNFCLFLYFYLSAETFWFVKCSVVILIGLLRNFPCRSELSL